MIKKQSFIEVSDFYNNEFVDYASYSTIRMIGSAIDGMKNVHRKIIKTTLDKNVTTRKKLTQYGSMVAEYTEYLHGNLEGSIVTMAQDFPGTNNLPLMAADGIFGTRFINEASAGRYIYSHGMPILFDIIKKEDEDILAKQYFEGNEIEPKFYLPSLPMLLINGSTGVATGFKQKVLPRDPKEITKYLKARLSGKITKKKFTNVPYFKGFNGYVTAGEKDGQWKICGTFTRTNSTTVEITEIPVGIELQTYIKILDKLKESNKIISYKDMSNKNIFKFTVKFSRANLAKLDDDQLLDALKLIKTETETYTAVDENLNVRTFKSVHEIIEYYIEVKLKYLKKRKDSLIEKYTKEIALDSSKHLFIKMIVTDKLIINKRKTESIIKDLDKVDKIIKRDDSYNYLLNMSIQSLTKEYMDKLSSLVKTKKEKLKEIKASELENLWLEDISNIKL